MRMRRSPKSRWSDVTVSPRLISMIHRNVLRIKALGGVFRFPTFDGVVLTAIVAFILSHLELPLVLTDTLTVGGDLPAHNYIASHLRQTLLCDGRIVSWSPGWWCGFPLFQFYFCLPYVAVVLLTTILPFNIALKLVCISGIVSLPLTAYCSGRWLRLPRPTPLLMAISTVLILFVKSHGIWGVNIYSTLAGMVANSVSFAFMLLALGSAYNDQCTGRFRVRTVLLLVAVLASHFFTSLVLGLTLAALPLFARRGRMCESAWLLLKEGGMAVLLMSWWLVPLVAGRRFSVDFGTNWDVSLMGSLPFYVFLLLPLAFCVLLSPRRRVLAPFGMMLAMCGFSTFLFEWGFQLVPVFANIRLWPFVFATLVFMIAIGTGTLLRRLPHNWMLVTLVLLVVVGYTESNEAGLVYGRAPVRDWARFDFSGLERTPGYSVFHDLVLPLKGTPGRLANDLSGENNAMGSSRVFECVPHVIGKPILEGGLVNSAIGSYFSYYIQSETSESCAGFPPLVSPTNFSLERATQHLALFNVKHFIAHSKTTRAAMRASKDWRLLRTSGQWDLFELLTHDGKYVFIPDNQPIGLTSRDWARDALDWMYDMDMLNQPFVFLSPGEDRDKVPFKMAPESDFKDAARRLKHVRMQSQTDSSDAQSKAQPPSSARTPEPGTKAIDWESAENDRIRFKTKAVGQPHIVKVTYYPNWRVRGAKAVYMVSPAFMLVYPTEEVVELYYGTVWSDIVGRSLTLFGVLTMCGLLVWNRLTARRDCAVETSR